MYSFFAWHLATLNKFKIKEKKKKIQKNNEKHAIHQKIISNASILYSLANIR
jgi:hypothetical protein